MSERVQRVDVRSAQGDYEVVVGAGTFAALPGRLAALEPAPTGIALLVDANVATHHAAAVDALVAAVRPTAFERVAGGEDAKRWERLGALLDAFAHARLDRRAFVLAVGGGALTDVAGLAAALWMRGVPWGAVPTTVLAAVDASVGGKTAVNLRAGKNLAGSFHAPRFVVVDPRFLPTLPEREVRSGLAEVIKAAVIGDPALFERLEDGRGAPLGDVAWSALLARAIAVKADVVSRDEREGSVRRHLNLGHTLGHALEKAAAERLTHGEAVAIGIAAACDLAVARSVCPADVADRVRRLLEAWRLPVRAPRGVEPEVLVPFLALDKKNVGGRLSYVLPTRIGDVCVVDDVRVDDVLAWVAANREA